MVCFATFFSRIVDIGVCVCVFTEAHNDPCVDGVVDARYISLRICRSSSNGPFPVHIPRPDVARSAIDDDGE